jgi:hypothetical protein
MDSRGADGTVQQRHDHHVSIPVTPTATGNGIQLQR